MKTLTKKEVDQLMCWLTSHSNDTSLELKISKDETMVAFIYHHMYWNPWTQDAEPWEDFDFFSLNQVADMVDCHSALWHEIAESLRAYYYAHISWEQFIKSKDGLNAVCKIYGDCTFKDGIGYMRCLFFANKQLHDCVENIAKCDEAISNKNFSEDELHNCLLESYELSQEKSRLEYEIDKLIYS